MAYALEALGKEVRHRQRRPGARALPGVPRRRSHRDRARGRADRRRRADRHGVQRPDAHRRQRARGPLHRSTSTTTPATRMYGALNWFDESAAACGEMVFDVIEALGVPLTIEIATHIYLAILTDTGSFHHSPTSRRRPSTSAGRRSKPGVNPAAMARRVFDSNSFGKLKLIGALLDADGAARRRPARGAVPGRRHLNATGTHLQRHRRADQPAADRARDPGGGVLQARRRRRRPRQHALEVRRRRPRGRRELRRRRPQERRRLHSSTGPLDATVAATACIDGAGWSSAIDDSGAASTTDRDCMNGVLVVDKPSGPTSHDVVAVVRRALKTPRHRPHRHARSARDRRARRCVVGHATRLAQFLVDRRQGIPRRRPPRARRRRPTTRRGCDRQRRRPEAERRGSTPRRRFEAALPDFRGTFPQTAAGFSAKKVDGVRAYKLARAERSRSN